MEESDAEEDLRRLTNLKPIKKKKHRFGLPVWHIPWPVDLQVSWQKLLSVGFNVAIASPFSYKLTDKQGLPTEGKAVGRLPVQLHYKHTDQLCKNISSSCVEKGRVAEEIQEIRVGGVREDQREQIKNISLLGYWWDSVRSSQKAD